MIVLALTWILGSCGCVDLPKPATPPVPDPTPSKDIPWTLDKEYRYVWIQRGEKVGETRFQLRRGTEETKPVLRLTAERTYSREGIHHQGRESTVLLLDGTPVRFEESLAVSVLPNRRARQDTTIEVREGKARVTYVPNGDAARKSSYELEVPKGTFLFASQAVEHWAIFTSRLRLDRDEEVLQVLYPDFRRVLAVTFRKSGTEDLEIKGEKIPTTRYGFSSAEGQLKGNVWLDKDQRLMQVEFPNPENPGASLKVVLATGAS